jgi:hypothetical protein
MMAIDTIQPDLGIIGISRLNSTYEQEYRCEVSGCQVETFVHVFIKRWAV